MAKLSNKVEVEMDGKRVLLYEPQTHPRCNQAAYHASTTPNLLALGTRDTGKSTMGRWDATIRCLMFERFRALVIRRKLSDLRKTHLFHIGHEMRQLGQPDFVRSFNEARFHNGSVIQLSHCENIKDVEDYLSSEWDLIFFDELSSFPLEMFLQISAAARTVPGKPYKALVRAGSNTLGIGSVWMKQWFVDKVVDPGEYPDYDADDFEVQYSWMDGNKYADRKDYEKRLKNLPSHVRKSWLDLEFVVEGAYFTDFQKKRTVEETVNGTTTVKVVPWHVIDHVPTWKGEDLFKLQWLGIRRAIDWGYDPDPCVCLWIALLPNKHEIVFKERSWKLTLAADVAKQIKRESEGMHITETFCDPSMFIKTGQSPYSIGDLFEQQGVALTPSQNDRALAGYAIHDHFNTLIDGHPQLQIIEPIGRYGCPDLIATIPMLQRDKNDATKIAEGNDHWAMALGYYCMGQAVPTQDPVNPTVPFWMRPKRTQREIIANTVIR